MKGTFIENQTMNKAITNTKNKIETEKNIWMNIYNRLQSGQNIGMSRENFSKLVADTIMIFSAKIYSLGEEK